MYAFDLAWQGADGREKSYSVGLRLPDGGGDEADFGVVEVVVVDGDDFAVGALDGAGVAQVGVAAVGAEDGLVAPGAGRCPC